MARSFILLVLGDFSVSWTEQNDAQVLPIIEKMLEEGMTFHIIEGKKKTPVKEVSQLSNRKAVFANNTLQLLYDTGLFAVSGLTVDEIQTTGRVARTAAEVTENDTVAVPPASGG